MRPFALIWGPSSPRWNSGATAAGLPGFVISEFERYLACGIEEKAAELQSSLDKPTPRALPSPPPPLEHDVAISGPRTHHHDDDAAEAGPAVFSDINITPLTDIFLVLPHHLHGDLDCAGRGGPGRRGRGSAGRPAEGSGEGAADGARDFTVAILKDGSTVIDGKIVDEQVLRAPLRANSTRTRRGAGHHPSGHRRAARQGRRGAWKWPKRAESTALPAPPTPAGSSAPNFSNPAAIPRRFRTRYWNALSFPVNPPVLRLSPFATNVRSADPAVAT